MNQVKLSTPDGSRLKAKPIAHPKETADICIRRQEPSARTSFQGFFRRCEIIERQIDDGEPQIAVAINDDHGAVYSTGERKKGRNF
jgi:hypothetical protein